LQLGARLSYPPIFYLFFLLLSALRAVDPLGTSKKTKAPNGTSEKIIESRENTRTSWWVPSNGGLVGEGAGLAGVGDGGGVALPCLALLCFALPVSSLLSVCRKKWGRAAAAAANVSSGDSGADLSFFLSFSLSLYLSLSNFERGTNEQGE
jgi:hypothetical protein